MRSSVVQRLGRAGRHARTAWGGLHRHDRRRPRLSDARRHRPLRGETGAVSRSARQGKLLSEMIPVSAPVLGERELEYVTECIRSGWISSAGHFLEEFEQRWAAYCGRRYGVAVSSGTAALQVALGVLALEPGDEVILPTFTMIAPAVAVVTRGAVPVVVDAQPDTWCMNVAQLESRVTARTRVLLPVHIYGHPVDMDAVLAVAARHNLAVIEDAAEAHGAEYFS